MNKSQSNSFFNFDDADVHDKEQKLQYKWHKKEWHKIHDGLKKVFPKHIPRMIVSWNVGKTRKWTEVVIL